jgi:hypothetical protein
MLFQTFPLFSAETTTMHNNEAEEKGRDKLYLEELRDKSKNDLV